MWNILHKYQNLSDFVLPNACHFWDLEHPRVSIHFSYFGTLQFFRLISISIRPFPISFRLFCFIDFSYFSRLLSFTHISQIIFRVFTLPHIFCFFIFGNILGKNSLSWISSNFFSDYRNLFLRFYRFYNSRAFILRYCIFKAYICTD